MNKACKNCGSSFVVTEEDLEFYDRVAPTVDGKHESISVPSDCPPCRQQFRLIHKNFFNFYKRTCSKTGKKIISMYREDAPFPVYDIPVWWSDSWSPLEFAQDVDLDKSFFDQMRSLSVRVPRPANVVVQSENSDYCNYCFETRNSYLIGGSVRNEDCAYGHIVWDSKNCFDCLHVFRCELSYECISSSDCYAVCYAKDCENCSESWYLDDCIGCKSCFGCVGLRNKEYHIFNVPHSKEEYRASVQKLSQTPGEVKRHMNELQKTHVVKNLRSIASENVTGDYILNSRNIRSSFDLKNCEDCAYCGTLNGFKDAMDCDYAATPTELTYNSMTSYGYAIVCCSNCMAVSSNLTYCDTCFSCKNCFGCVGMRNAQFCILNKQYTEKDFNQLAAKIIAKMKSDGEWGKFLPSSMCPFGYNETLAFEFFPLTKEQSIERGFSWSDYKAPAPEAQKIIPASQLPGKIEDVTDDSIHWAISCEVTGRPFKLIKQELDFYRKMKLPVPRVHPDERHRRRMDMRNPRVLHDRQCAKCSKEIRTIYAPDRPEIVYCEECYLKEVY